MLSQNYFVSKEFILTQVTQEAIFEHYFGQGIDLSKKYKSPLRDDKSAGCSFYYGESADLLFFDSKEGNMDCFKFIMKLHNCSYYDAIIRIKLDFNLIKSKNIQIINEEKEPYLKKIQIKKKEFTLEEIAYWQLPDMEVTEQLLHKYKIYSISDLWFNDIYKGYNLKMTFAFKQENPYNYQIYRPLVDKNLRFRTNNGSYIYGWNTLKIGEDVYINKSPKDSFFANIAGYNSIGSIGEGFNLPTEKIEYLQKNCKNIFICYDNDDAGIKFTEKIVNQYPFIIPKYPLIGKDFTDMIVTKGVQWVKDNW